MIYKVFIVEDDASLLEIAIHQLEAANYIVHPFTSAEEAWKSFDKVTPDLVLTDLVLEGGINGDQLLKKIKGYNTNIPVILMTANGSIDSAVDCVKSGAWNYLTKPFHWDDMLSQIKKALDYRSIKDENIKLKKLVGEYSGFESIVGNSPIMSNIKNQLISVSHADAPVLIQGESGTGKELVAKSIHLNSPRKDKPFIAVNCGAIVEELAESELFGHVKGAFTGAFQQKNGFFMEAQGGSLFLDEIGELPLNLQVKLLRVLQESEITPVGQSKSFPIDVRIISATNVDIHEAVRCGDFREDLFYRIAVLPISLPPLRDRLEDIETLSLMFLDKIGRSNCSFSQDFLAKMKLYAWQGNIRELENFITRLSVMNTDIECFQEKHFPESNFNIKPKQPISYEIPDEGLDLDIHMKKLIESALGKCAGNQTKASSLLGVTRSALIYRMQKFNID